MSAPLLIDECVNHQWVLPPFLSLAPCVFVKDVAKAAMDEDVIALARREGFVLLTEDFDFARLLFAERRPPPLGVILVSLYQLQPQQRLARVTTEAASALAEANDAMVVIDPTTRRRKVFDWGA